MLLNHLETISLVVLQRIWCPATTSSGNMAGTRKDITSVPPNKISNWENVCFGAHAIAQPRKHKNNATFKSLKGLRK